MGLDFIKQCAPVFQRSWDKGRDELATPTLYTQFPMLKDQTYRAVGKENVQFKPGQEVILKLDGTVVLVCDRSDTVGAINEPPHHLLEAFSAGHGIALGTVQKVMMEGRVADMSIS